MGMDKEYTFTEWCHNTGKVPESVATQHRRLVNRGVLTLAWDRDRIPTPEEITAHFSTDPKPTRTPTRTPTPKPARDIQTPTATHIQTPAPQTPDVQTPTTTDTPAPDVQTPAPTDTSNDTDNGKIKVRLSAAQIEDIRTVLACLNVLDGIMIVVGLCLLFGWVGLIASGFAIGILYVAIQISKDADLGTAANCAMFLVFVICSAGAWLHYTTLFNNIDSYVTLTLKKETVCTAIGCFISLVSFLSLVIGRAITGAKYRQFG